MDTIVTCSFWSAIVLVPVVFVGAMWRLRKLRLIRRLVASMLFSGALFASFLTLAGTIFLRDGLGPDMAETHGLEALARCWIGIGIGLTIGAVLIVSGVLLARPSRRPNYRSA